MIVAPGSAPNNPMKRSFLSVSLHQFKSYSDYRDSGIQWLGEIPAHWAVKRLKHTIDVNPSSSEIRTLPADLDLDVSFVPMEAVAEYGGLDLSHTKPLKDVTLGFTCFQDEDIVVAKITPCFENGKGSRAAGLVNGLAFGTTELHVLRASPAIDVQFLFYLTLSHAGRKHGEAEMYGAGGQKRVPTSFVQNFLHPLPDLTEQRAITAFLDRETARIDALVDKVQEAIIHLKELRTTLISAAVTGKIDVREMAE